MLDYIVLFSIIVVALALCRQLFIFKARLRSQFTELNKLQKAVKNQDTGAKMLVRRDLELIRANERLHEVDELKSNFISVVAHQLRTPLSGIKWTINMILNGEMGELNTEQKSFLMKSYESNDRMITLVNDMLGADRIESDKLRYQFIPTKISDLLDNLLYEMLPMANKKNLHIEFSNRDIDLPKVYVDSEKMRAALQNLLENAIRYTPNGGKIDISFQVISGFLEISIKDTGIGIPKDQAKNIFNRFFRAQNAIKMETDGSGLGLFITKAIVEKHGGRIWFESDLDKGSNFHFTIPIAR